MKKAIKMTEEDNVATALEDIETHNAVEIINDSNVIIGQINAQERIPFGYKVALADMAKGSYVIKYGVKVATAVHSIKSGCLVHVHNAESMRVILPESVKNEVLAEIGYRAE